MGSNLVVRRATARYLDLVIAGKCFEQDGIRVGGPGNDRTGRVIGGHAYAQKSTAAREDFKCRQTQWLSGRWSKPIGCRVTCIDDAITVVVVGVRRLGSRGFGLSKAHAERGWCPCGGLVANEAVCFEYHGAAYFDVAEPEVRLGVL